MFIYRYAIETSTVTESRAFLQQYLQYLRLHQSLAEGVGEDEGQSAGTRVPDQPPALNCNGSNSSSNSGSGYNTFSPNTAPTPTSTAGAAGDWGYVSFRPEGVDDPGGSDGEGDGEGLPLLPRDGGSGSGRSSTRRRSGTGAGTGSVAYVGYLWWAGITGAGSSSTHSLTPTPQRPREHCLWRCLECVGVSRAMLSHCLGNLCSHCLGYCVTAGMTALSAARYYLLPLCSPALCCCWAAAPTPPTATQSVPDCHPLSPRVTGFWAAKCAYASVTAALCVVYTYLHCYTTADSVYTTNPAADSAYTTSVSVPLPLTLLERLPDRPSGALWVRQAVLLPGVGVLLWLSQGYWVWWVCSAGWASGTRLGTMKYMVTRSKQVCYRLYRNQVRHHV